MRAAPVPFATAAAAATAVAMSGAVFLYILNFPSFRCTTGGNLQRRRQAGGIGRKLHLLGRLLWR
eukprot:scaffold46457_cov21-Tisochrysis_lutea.AAC.1